jgi:hypothetical protein
VPTLARSPDAVRTRPIDRESCSVSWRYVGQGCATAVSRSAESRVSRRVIGRPRGPRSSTGRSGLGEADLWGRLRARAAGRGVSRPLKGRHAAFGGRLPAGTPGCERARPSPDDRSVVDTRRWLGWMPGVGWRASRARRPFGGRHASGGEGLRATDGDHEREPTLRPIRMVSIGVDRRWSLRSHPAVVSWRLDGRHGRRGGGCMGWRVGVGELAVGRSTRAGAGGRVGWPGGRGDLAVGGSTRAGGWACGLAGGVSSWPFNGRHAPSHPTLAATRKAKPARHPPRTPNPRVVPWTVDTRVAEMSVLRPSRHCEGRYPALPLRPFRR